MTTDLTYELEFFKVLWQKIIQSLTEETIYIEISLIFYFLIMKKARIEEKFKKMGACFSLEKSKTENVCSAVDSVPQWCYFCISAKDIAKIDLTKKLG